MRENKVVNVKFIGGIIGLFNVPRKRLEKVIQEANGQGWSVRQILPGNPNLIFMVVALIVLGLTLLLYMPLPGYMVVLEREKPAEEEDQPSEFVGPPVS